MEQGISEIFCDGAGAKGEPLAVYRALRQLFCSGCGTPIAVGSLFTRKAVPGFGPRILPRCARCTPFEVKRAGAGQRAEAEAEPEAGTAEPESAEARPAADSGPAETGQEASDSAQATAEPGRAGTESGQAGAKSAMIENLLTPEPGEAPGETAERPRDMSEEAARRLGPALSRSRRGPR